MGSDTEPDPYSIPKLPLFSIPPHHPPEPSGISTPPLQTSASIPFRWEEQPGKPRPCTTLIIHHTNTNTKCLDLPPRLAMVDPTKTYSPSPTTVLDGPGDGAGSSFFSSSSFRFGKDKDKERRRGERRRRSFDSNCSGGWSPADDDDGGQMLLGSKVDRRDGGRGLFGSFRLKGTHKPKGSSVISPSSTSSIDAGFLKGRKMRRNSSMSKVTGSHFWTKIYDGFKQVVPWRKKPKIECFTL